MLAGLILAAVCLEAPTFDLEGPVCDRPAVACGCSEGMTWDAVPGAERYELQRETVSTGSLVDVGAVPARIPAEEGEVDGPRFWWFGRDSVMPRAGTLYRYRIRACNAAGCGPWNDPVEYRGADYACYQDGREVACYVGDEVASR
jgi:hypothetical protein